MKLVLSVLICFFVLAGNLSAAQKNTLVGLNTSGTVFEIDPATGTLTTKIQDQITNFELGPIARKKDTLYYIAAPSGTQESAIYTANLKTNTLSHVDLDRNDDDFRALFVNGKNLIAVLYNGTAGTAGIYRIDPTTGVTTLLTDLSSLHVEPIGGAAVRRGKFFFILAKTSENGRQLIRFKAKGPILVKDVITKEGADVLCDRLKQNPKHTGFVCVASPSDTQVDVCSLSLSGVTKCTGTLPSIFRIASGHTMMTSGKSYYVIGYATGEDNNQRIVKFNKAGKELGAPVVSTLIIGARFGVEEEEETPPAS